jgi:hypothetical protein
MGRNALSHRASKSISAGPLPASAFVVFFPKGMTMKQTGIGMDGNLLLGDSAEL